jgi:hypothetical protein
LLQSRVARWFVFKPKIPIWVNFGAPYIGKCLYISWPFWNILRTWWIFYYGNLLHLVLIWCIFSGFGILYREKSGNPASKFLSTSCSRNRNALVQASVGRAVLPLKHRCVPKTFLLPSCQFTAYMKISVSGTDMALSFMPGALHHHKGDVGYTVAPILA